MLKSNVLLLGTLIGIGAAGWLFADAPAKKTTIKSVMIATHDMKDSPLQRARAGLGKENPDWDALDIDSAAFVKMASVLRSSYKRDALTKEYVTSAKQFAAAVEEKDKAGSEKALQGLRSSCFRCHGYGMRLHPKAKPDNVGR